MKIREYVIVSAQGKGTAPKKGILRKILFMTTFESMIIILIKYEETQGRIFIIYGMRDKEV